MSGHNCEECGRSGASEPIAMCAECHDEAEAAAESRGYAAAVADILRDAPALVRAIVSAADSDLGKTLDPEFCEEPEYLDERMARLVAIVTAHVGAAKKGGGT